VVTGQEAFACVSRCISTHQSLFGQELWSAGTHAHWRRCRDVHISRCISAHQSWSYGAQVPMRTGGTLVHAGLPIRCAYISSTELQPSIHVSSSFGHLPQCLCTQYSPGFHLRYSAQPPTQLACTSSPMCSLVCSVAPCEGPASAPSLYLSLHALQSLRTALDCLLLLALLSTATCALYVHSHTY